MRLTLPTIRQAAESSAGPAYLAERVQWLVKLRWTALGGIVVVIGVAVLLDALESVMPLVALTLVLAAANFTWWRTGRLGKAAAMGDLEDQVRWQLIFDALVLTGLLHFAGGSDNPFFIFVLFPPAIAGMLLPLRKAMVVGAVAAGSYATTIVAEVTGALAHHPLHIADHHLHESIAEGSLWVSPIFLGGHIFGVSCGVFGVLFFVGAITRRLRESEAREREHQRVVLVHERLARAGALAAGVAHSIRNPLHGVLSCVEMLQARVGDETEGAAELLELMSEGVNRIERVTSRLLALTRDGAPERLPTDLRLLVTDALRFVEARAAARGVTLDVAFDALPKLELDSVRMAEALANVLDNAVEATSEGSVVRVRGLNRVAERDQVELAISDEGPGIPPELRTTVFDPFFTTKPVGEGTGLGLAITRAIVEHHNGEVRIDAGPSGGAVVRILLPATMVVGGEAMEP